MAFPTQRDHIEKALSLLITQWKGKPNMEALVTSFTENFQVLEDVLFELLTEQDLFVAVGQQLDNIGEKVGLSRDFREDEVYRRALLEKIVKNRSNGSPETVLPLVKFVIEKWLEEDDVFVHGFEHFPAEAYVYVDKLANTQDANLLKDISAIGVGTTLVCDNNGDSFVSGEYVDGLTDWDRSYFPEVVEGRQGANPLAEIIGVSGATPEEYPFTTDAGFISFLTTPYNVLTEDNPVTYAEAYGDAVEVFLRSQGSFNWKQSTEASRPTWEEIPKDGIGGVAIKQTQMLSFDGVNDYLASGVSSFGDCTNGLYAAPNNSFHIVEIFCIPATGAVNTLTSQCGDYPPHAMWHSYVQDTLHTVIRGEDNESTERLSDGKIHIVQYNVDNGVVTRRIDGGNRVTLNVGGVPSDVDLQEILFGANNPDNPQNFLSGYGFAPVILDYSLSNAEEQTEFDWWDARVRKWQKDAVDAGLFSDFTDVLSVLDERYTATRASRATRWNADGVLEEVGANVIRAHQYQQHDPITGEPLGLLIEGQAVNQIPNPRCEGASVGAPGAGPTGWTLGQTAGLTREVLDVTPYKGISRWRIRLYGEATGASAFFVPCQSSTVAASSGQTWTNSMFLAYENNGGDSEPGGFWLNIAERTASGVLVGDPKSSPALPLTDTLERYSYTVTLTNGPTVERASPQISMVLVIGASYDFIFDIGLPQFVQAPFATSPILPPVGAPAASTRARDILQCTNLSRINFNPNAGSMFAEFVWPPGVTAAFSRVWQFDDGTGGNSIRVELRSNGTVVFQVFDGGVVQAVRNPAVTSSPGDICRVAVSWKEDSFRISVNGFDYPEDTSGSIPIVSVLNVGRHNAGGAELNSTIRQVLYRPTASTQEELNAWTARTLPFPNILWEGKAGFYGDPFDSTTLFTTA